MADDNTSHVSPGERDWGLTCAEVLELTTEYLEDSLAPADRDRFRDHLGRCEGCETVMSQITDVIAATGQLNESDVEPATMSSLLAAFRDWKRPVDDG